MMDLCLRFLRPAGQMLALGLVSPLLLSAAQPVFPVPKYEPYAVPSPLALAEGDLNGDGTPDTLYAAASATAGSTTLTGALRSASGGAPTLAAPTTIDCTANAVLLADLNNDKKLDAVVSCNENRAVILAGRGDGAFATPVSYPVPAAARAVAADFNKDGYLDLAIATSTGDATSVFAVLLNTAASAAPTFSQPVLYKDSNGVNRIFTGDINGDGNTDIVAGATAGSTGTASVYNGDGKGGFATGVARTLGDQFTVGSFFGRPTGDFAIVSGFAGSGDTQVALQPGSSGSLTQYPVEIEVREPHAVDLNNDGNVDLVLPGPTTRIMLGDGAGHLTVGQTYATPGDYFTARHETNGSISLVFSTPRGFYTLAGRGDGTFDGIPSTYASTAAAAGDFNGDGLTDYVAAQLGARAGAIATARGDGRFSTTLLSNVVPGQQDQAAVVADFNRDGFADAVATSAGTPAQATQLVFAAGSAAGLSSTTSSSAAREGITAMAAAEFTGDGSPDIAAAYFDSAASTRGLVLFPGKGNGSFGGPSTIATGAGASASAPPLSADLNKDGKPDLVWNGSVYLNQGGTFAASSLLLAGTPRLLADLDGDGTADLVLDNRVYHGHGDGTFAATPFFTATLPPSATVTSVSSGDLNGDGAADLIVQSSSDMTTVSVSYGDGHGGFTPDGNVYVLGPSAVSTGALGRINNRAPPIAASNRLDYLALLDGAAVSLLNQGNPAPKPSAGLPTAIAFTGTSRVALPLVPTSISLSITGGSGTLPTGLVTLSGSGGKTLGTANVLNGQATVTVTFPAEGSYMVSATYSGDASYAPAAAATTTITVARQQYPVVLNLSDTYPAQREVQLAASYAGYNPGKVITFSANGGVIGTAPVAGGLATLNYTFPSIGTYSIVASYPGDVSNLPSTSETVEVTTVAAPDFALSASPSTVTVNAGEKASWTVTVTSINNYDGDVTVACNPDNCGSASVPVSPGAPGQATFTVQTALPNARPNARVTPMVASALLLLAFGRRRRSGRTPLLRTGLFALCALAGTVTLCGCGGSSKPVTPPPSQSTTYTIPIMGTDASIGVTHTYTLTLVVNAPATN